MNIINISRIKSKQYENLKESKNLNHKSDPETLESSLVVNKDQVTISQESKKILKDQRSLMIEEMEENLHLIEQFKEEMEAFREEDNPYAAELKCILIALRIINGDEVPQGDKKFLMEHKPDMYKNAILFKRINKDPKKHKSLIEDKSEDNLEKLSSESQELISQLSSELSSEESAPSKDSQSSDT